MGKSIPSPNRSQTADPPRPPHRNAARTAGGDVDVVVAHGNVGHDLQLRARGIKHRRIDRVCQQAHNRIDALDALQKLLAGNGAATDIQINVARRFQFRNDC